MINLNLFLIFDEMDGIINFINLFVLELYECFLLNKFCFEGEG